MDIFTYINTFNKCDEKTKKYIFSFFVTTYPKFWVLIEQFNNELFDTIPEPDLDIRDAVELIQQTNSIQHVRNILTHCIQLNNIWKLKTYSYKFNPIISQFRIIKCREYTNQHINQDVYATFIYPKYRMLVIFNFNLVWYMVKVGQNSIVNNKKMREFFQHEIANKLTQNFYTLDICYDTKRGDDILSYFILDAFIFDGISLVTHSFQRRYDILKATDLPIYPIQNTIQNGQSYLLRRFDDNMYGRSEYKFVTSRIDTMLLHLIVGEIGVNNQIKFLIAQLDPIHDKFHIVHTIPKNAGAFNFNKEYTSVGRCVFGNEYDWKLPKNKQIAGVMENVNYYKHPIGVILSFTNSNKLNNRTNIQQIVQHPPADRGVYVKL